MESNGASVDVQPDLSGQGFDPTAGQFEGNVENTSDQPQGGEGIGDDEFGTQSLPPELEETRRQLLRSYHQKTQALAEERGRIGTELESFRQKADMLDKLMSKQWFQKASQDEQSRLAGGGTQFEIPEEQFEAARNGDKNAFKTIVSAMAQQMLNAQVGPALGAQNETIADIKLNQELDNAISQYPQIQDLIDSEDPEFHSYLDQGYDYETAFQKIAFARSSRGSRSDDGPSQEELAQQSRAGAVARGGMVQARGSQVLKAKNFEDAFDQAFAALQSGHKDFTFERG